MGAASAFLQATANPAASTALPQAKAFAHQRFLEGEQKNGRAYQTLQISCCPRQARLVTPIEAQNVLASTGQNGCIAASFEVSNRVLFTVATQALKAKARRQSAPAKKSARVIHRRGEAARHQLT